MAMLCAVLTATAQTKSFCIANNGKAATIVVDKNDFHSVVRAVSDLSADVQRVTGTEAPLLSPQLVGRTDAEKILSQFGKAGKGLVIVGTIGKSKLIDRLIKQKKLDVSQVKGQWESFVIDVVDGNLVVAGSDKRGTIYGIYEISRRIGVSPWYWWADVPVEHRDVVCWNDGRVVMPSPSVKYRGIFINDEDWGLLQWSATNYEKELGDIGPRTYARVCELLLRLRANMLAPAMHSCTGAFYSHPESKVVCDSFGIVITTSHCEPLLLNNAADSEWNLQRDGDWNYKTNRQTIYKKWDDRLAEASQYENIYTVAMRGVHDAGLRGNLPIEERVPLIEQVIKDQRQLLVKHHAYTPSPLEGAEETSIPQIFVPYKETMDIYEHGLQVPDDITLVWVDDNYGYMKRVSNAQEQQRKGRAGVYYHLSYLGAPHDYLWLNTTPPVLMYEELSKAYAAGADRYWLLNVGDIKPMELGIQTFMEMAWNIGYNKNGKQNFSIEDAYIHQAEFLAKTFTNCTGNHTSHLSFLTSHFQNILDEYYRLAWSRKPEYMGWEYEWDDPAHTGLKPTEFSFENYDEAQRRLSDYERISNEVERMARALPSGQTASFYELVQFPIQAAAQMNRKFLMAQLNQQLLAEHRLPEANWAARQMEQAYDSINTLNRRYNELLNGKWRGMMTVPPGFCALYQQKPVVTYTAGAGEQAVDLRPRRVATEGCATLKLSAYSRKDAGVQLIDGMGYDWQVVRLNQGEVSYELPAISADTVEVLLYAVPLWPLHEGLSNRIGISVDGGKMQAFENKFKEYSRSWKDQVMRNGVLFRLRVPLDPAQPKHMLTLHTIDPGQMVQRIIVDWGGLKPSYVGPEL